VSLRRQHRRIALSGARTGRNSPGRSRLTMHTHHVRERAPGPQFSIHGDD